MFQEKEKERDWRWRYSAWIGVMYGPIPVGLIVAAVLFAGYVIYHVMK